MRAEQYLGQIKAIERMIECKRRDAEMWRSMAEGMNGQHDGDRVQDSFTQDRMADSIAKAVDCERESEAMVLALTETKERIIRQIDSLEQLNHSVVLNEYYVHEMTIQQIAEEWGRSCRQVMRVKNDAIKEFSQKFNKYFK